MQLASNAVCEIRFCSALISLSLCVAAHAQEPPPAVGMPPRLQEIEHAWAKRTHHIKSVDLTTDIDQLVKGRGDRPPDRPDDPFGVALPKEDRTLKLTGEYAYERGKISIATVSETIDPEDPERLRSQRLRVTFDGEEYREWGQETELPMGAIVVTDAAPPRMYVDVNYLAVGLWLFPKKVVHDVGWAIDRATIEDRDVIVDGVTCRRLRIPRTNARSTSAIDVDPARDCVPLQWQTWSSGKLSMRLSIKYGERESIGPVVRGWRVELFEHGEIKSSRDGRITRLEVNGDVDDGRFSNEFSVGTHVTKDSGGKRSYHIQRPEGLAPLKKEEFGKLKPARVA